jgi:chromosome segregation ATPase
LNQVLYFYDIADDMEQQLEILWESEGAPTESAAQLSNQSLPLDSAAHEDREESAMVPENFQDNPLSDSPSELAVPMSSVSELLSEVVQSIQLSASGEPPSEDQRIRQLEQALYQCQLYIDELKQKLSDQEFLEGQLATTEAFSHIQKQAIETLKFQVADQQTLQTELETAQQQTQTMQTELTEATALVQKKESEFSALQIQLRQDQVEMDRLKDKKAQVTAQLDALQGSMVQETQQRIIAQKTADRLRTELRSRDLSARSLETKLQRAEEMLAQRESMITALKDRNQPDSQKDQFIQGISATLLKAQRQITELQNELSNQTILQAQLQHTAHELEQDGKVVQTRSEQLEQQVNDLQEQVLRQAQQASEYETAVQHWKTRSIEAEEWTAQVAQLWETLKAEAPAGTISPDLTQTLTALSSWFQGVKSNGTSLDAQVSPKEFLGRRSRWSSG